MKPDLYFYVPSLSFHKKYHFSLDIKDRILEVYYTSKILSLT